MNSVCLYGLGGGLGHATRVLALGQALIQAQPSLHIDYILPGRLEHLPLFAGKSVHVAPPECQEDASQLARWLEKLWLAHPPDLLVVDVFPQGVLAEFMECRRFPHNSVLLTRICRSGYYENPQMRSALQRYREIFWVESCPPPPELRGAREVGPLTLFRRSQLLAPSLARQQLGLGPADGLGVLVLRAGPPDIQRELVTALRQLPATAVGGSDPGFESENLHAVGGRARVAWADHNQPAWMPLFPYYPGADLIVSAAGYHALYELHHLHIPTIFWPQRRLYDDQFLRLRLLEVGRQPKRWIVETSGEFHKAFEEFEKLRGQMDFRQRGRESEYQGAQRLANALLNR